LLVPEFGSWPPISFFGGQEFLDIWPSLSQTTILTGFKWSPLVISAVERNFFLLSDRRDTNARPHTQISTQPQFPKVSAIAPAGLYPGLLALHIRRGDYKRHCARLANWGGTFSSFNTYDGPLDPWIPYDDSIEVRADIFHIRSTNFHLSG
jgi:hypothetical protein